MKKEKLLFISFLVIFTALFIFSFFSRYKYLIDSLVATSIIIFLFSFYKELNLTKTIFSLIFVSLLLHNLGVFGFYNQSPLPFSYDRLTHFVGGLSLALFFINFFNKNLKTKFFFLVLFAVAASLGVGSIIEISEYIGFLFVGEGEGFFYFGGTGDITLKGNLDGAWVNSSTDMIYNLLGSLAGLSIFLFYEKPKQF